MTIGIPYAHVRYEADGSGGGALRAFVTCPECGESIELRHRKDIDSMSSAEYAVHWHDKHEGQEDGTRQA